MADTCRLSTALANAYPITHPLCLMTLSPYNTSPLSSTCRTLGRRVNTSLFTQTCWTIGCTPLWWKDGATSLSCAPTPSSKISSAPTRAGDSCQTDGDACSAACPICVDSEQPRSDRVGKNTVWLHLGTLTICWELTHCPRGFSRFSTVLKLGWAYTVQDAYCNKKQEI